MTYILKNLQKNIPTESGGDIQAAVAGHSREKTLPDGRVITEQVSGYIQRRSTAAKKPVGTQSPSKIESTSVQTKQPTTAIPQFGSNTPQQMDEEDLQYPQGLVLTPHFRNQNKVTNVGESYNKYVKKFAEQLKKKQLVGRESSYKGNGHKNSKEFVDSHIKQTYQSKSGFGVGITASSVLNLFKTLPEEMLRRGGRTPSNADDNTLGSMKYHFHKKFGDVNSKLEKSIQPDDTLNVEKDINRIIDEILEDTPADGEGHTALNLLPELLEDPDFVAAIPQEFFNEARLLFVRTYKNIEGFPSKKHLVALIRTEDVDEVRDMVNEQVKNISVTSSPAEFVKVAIIYHRGSDKEFKNGKKAKLSTVGLLNTNQLSKLLSTILEYR